jgi:polyhydroxybutyrate depolymerase
MVACLLASFLFSGPVTKTFNVDGVERTAIIYPSDSAAPAPVVFFFHGHFGKAQASAREGRIRNAWPEATVVYPQGLITDSPLLGKGTGWQRTFGDLGDRDLKFVDAMLASVKQDFHADPAKIYACGMSNGAFFTLLLLAARPNDFAAFASVAGIGGTFLRQLATPRPVMIVNGRADKLVPIAAAERTGNFLVRFYQAVQPGTKSGDFVWYDTKVGPRTLGVEVHDGGHIWPASADADIVQFFKAH